MRKETRCRHIGYSFRLAARVLLYAPSHRQDGTYHGLCYTSRGALAGQEIDQCTMSRQDWSLIVDPLNYFLFQPVFLNWCNKRCGMWYPVWEEYIYIYIYLFFNLLLIRKSSSCGDFGFPFSLFEWPFIMSSTQRITINKMLSALFNLLCMKHFLPSASSKESTASVFILVKCNHLAQMRKDVSGKRDAVKSFRFPHPLHLVLLVLSESSFYAKYFCI